MPFDTQCKLPDPSELNIKRALNHLKLNLRNTGGVCHEGYLALD